MEQILLLLIHQASVIQSTMISAGSRSLRLVFSFNFLFRTSDHRHNQKHKIKYRFKNNKQINESAKLYITRNLSNSGEMTSRIAQVRDFQILSRPRRFLKAGSIVCNDETRAAGMISCLSTLRCMSDS